MNLNFPITLRIEGGESLFINLRVTGEAGVFGVDPTSLDMVEDNGMKILLLFSILLERFILTLQKKN